MSLKNIVLGMSLLAATAIAASGCDRGINNVDTAGRSAEPSSEAAPSTDPSGSDTTIPENTGTDTGTSTGAGTQTDPYCPAGFLSHGNPHLCCKIDDPNSCIIIDPAPPKRPGVGALDPTNIAVMEPDTPVQPVGPKPPVTPVGPGESESCTYDPFLHHVICTPSSHQGTFGEAKDL